MVYFELMNMNGCYWIKLSRCGNQDLQLGSRIIVPKEHLKIARSFNCGWRVKSRIRPGGTVEFRFAHTTSHYGPHVFSRPCGAYATRHTQPAVKTAG
jgi:hypothetical protein